MIKISYLFFWYENMDDEFYFSRYIKHHFGDMKIVNHNDNPDILFVSVFGYNLDYIKQINAKIKIFFSGENEFYHFNNSYLFKDESLKENFDIVLNFKYNNTRFPLWILYYKYLDYDENDNIITFIQSSYDKNVKKEKEFLTTLLSNSDSRQNNLRPYLYNFMSTYDKVICASKLFNNYPKICDGHDEKIKHISKSVFNICPENSSGEGYFTEKMFQALEAGTIPIYWASNFPEVNIINRNKYIFCDINDSNNIQKTIDDAITNKEIRQTYIDGDVFTKDAKKYLKTYYDNLKNNIKTQMDKKNISYNLPL